MNPYFRALLLVFACFNCFSRSRSSSSYPLPSSCGPLPDTTPMSFIFISSIFAAAATSTLWALFAREDVALTGIALDYFAIFLPGTIFGFQLASSTGSAGLLLFAIICAATAAFGVGLIVWSARQPVRDTRPTPPLVRWSFVVFVIALIIAGGALVLKTPNILPWRVTPELSVLSGWFFLGAAAYFAYGVMRPGWWNTAGQLAGFLAYDVILLVPFLQRLPTIAPELRTSLIIYLIVVTYSGLLAIYYLFINAETRIIRRQA